GSEEGERVEQVFKVSEFQGFKETRASYQGIALAMPKSPKPRRPFWGLGVITDPSTSIRAPRQQVLRFAQDDNLAGKVLEKRLPLTSPPQIRRGGPGSAAGICRDLPGRR